MSGSEQLSGSEFDDDQIYRRRRRMRTKQEAQLWLIAILVIYSAKGLFIYIHHPAPTTKGAEILNEIWTIALVTCMWRRQMWARYVFCVYSVFSSLLHLILLPSVLSTATSVPITFIAAGVIDIGIAAALICVPSIRRFTKYT